MSMSTLPVSREQIRALCALVGRWEFKLHFVDGSHVDGHIYVDADEGEQFDLEPQPPHMGAVAIELCDDGPNDCFVYTRQEFEALAAKHGVPGIPLPDRFPEMRPFSCTEERGAYWDANPPKGGRGGNW